MRSCFYHPTIAATYFCCNCGVCSCDNCSDERAFNEANCFICSAELKSLGSAHQAEPFWRRIDKSFKYPLTTEVLIFLVVLSFVSSFLQFIPYSFVFQLLITGVLMKYCFCCLQATAQGDFKPADITDSYEGGLDVLGKLLLVTVALFAVSGFCVSLLGIGFGGMLSVIVLSLLPAAIIILALSKSILAALNPLHLLHLVLSIGLPYVLIIGFMVIMSSSAAVINEVFYGNFSFISRLLQSFVINFYMVVMFHMMGYMIFQYQDKLGFVAKSYDGAFSIRPDLDKLKSKLSMLLKLGKFKQLESIYEKEIARYPSEVTLQDDYFKLLYAVGNSSAIKSISDLYLKNLLLKKNHKSKAVYKKVLHIAPDYKVGQAGLRFELAKLFFESGDFKAVVKLLNGLHKEFPDYLMLAEAYQLMFNTLAEIPGKEKEAVQFKQYSDKLLSKKVQKRKK